MHAVVDSVEQNLSERSRLRSTVGLVAGVLGDARTYRALVFLCTDVVAAVLAAIIVLTTTILTVALIPVLPAAIVPAFVLFWASRWVARFDRFRIAAITGVRIPAASLSKEGSRWTRLKRAVASLAVWKEFAFHIVHLVVGPVFGLLTLAAWSLAIAFVTLPLYRPADMTGHVDRLMLDVSTGRGQITAVLTGVILLAVLVPWLTRGLALVSVGIAKALLGNESATLRDEVERLETSRAELVEAAEAERRRIERDLHDGAQQRLVALAMNLGMAQAMFERDPAMTRSLIDDAHREAKLALGEIRDLVRGLHPPILTERGLSPALANLTGRCPVPVDLDVQVERRLTPSIEGIAYFIVSETLTNVAKHAAASRVRVSAIDEGHRLVLEVADDGVGGAEAGAGGTGLRGLAERVGGVDGVFIVSSPIAGPTTVRAELPVATTAPSPSQSSRRGDSALPS